MIPGGSGYSLDIAAISGTARALGGPRRREPEDHLLERRGSRSFRRAGCAGAGAAGRRHRGPAAHRDRHGPGKSRPSHRRGGRVVRLAALPAAGRLGVPDPGDRAAGAAGARYRNLVDSASARQGQRSAGAGRGAGPCRRRAPAAHDDRRGRQAVRLEPGPGRGPRPGGDEDGAGPGGLLSDTPARRVGRVPAAHRDAPQRCPPCAGVPRFRLRAPGARNRHPFRESAANR